MPDFTIYRVDTGQILKVFTGRADDAALNVPEGCAAVEGSYGDETYIVADGRPQRKPALPSDIEEMRAEARRLLDLEYRDQAAGLFDPLVFAQGTRGPPTPEYTAMQDALAALAQERGNKRAALAVAKTQTAIRDLVPSVAADRRFR